MVIGDWALDIDWSLGFGHWGLPAIPTPLLPIEQLLHLRRHRVEEVVLPLAEEGEVRRRVTHEGAQDPAHLGAHDAVEDDPDLEDAQRGVVRWNKILEEHGLNERLAMPSKRFNRHVGVYADHRFDPQGNPVDDAAWEARRTGWLPTQADTDYVRESMIPVYEPGKVAGWLAPPTRGFGRKPLDFEYVLFH